MKKSSKHIFGDLKKQPNPEVSDTKINTNKWKEDEKLILVNRCKFEVQYLGFMALKTAADNEKCSSVMNEMLKTKKRHKSFLCVNVHSLVVTSRTDHELLIDQTLCNVRIVSSYTPIPFSMFFTSFDTFNNEHKLFGFVAVKSVSERLVAAISFALKEFSKRESTSVIKSHEQLASKYSFEEKAQKQISTKCNRSPLPMRDASPQICREKTSSHLIAIPRPRPGGIGVRKTSMETTQTLNPDLQKLETLQYSKSESEEINMFENDKLEKVKQINEIFHKQQHQNPVTLSNENLFYLSKENKDNKSKYHSIEILNNKNNIIDAGWSDKIIEKPKEPTKHESNDEFDKYVASFVKKKLFAIKWKLLFIQN